MSRARATLYHHDKAPDKSPIVSAKEKDWTHEYCYVKNILVFAFVIISFSLFHSFLHPMDDLIVISPKQHTNDTERWNYYSNNSFIALPKIWTVSKLCCLGAKQTTEKINHVFKICEYVSFRLMQFVHWAELSWAERSRDEMSRVLIVSLIVCAYILYMYVYVLLRAHKARAQYSQALMHCCGHHQ